MYLEHWKALYNLGVGSEGAQDWSRVSDTKMLPTLKRQLASSVDPTDGLGNVIAFLDILIVMSPFSSAARSAVTKLVTRIAVDPYAKFFADHNGPSADGTGVWPALLIYMIKHNIEIPQSWGLQSVGDADALLQSLDIASLNVNKVRDITVYDYSEFLAVSEEGTKAVHDIHIWRKLDATTDNQVSIAYCALALAFTEKQEDQAEAFQAAEKWASIDRSNNTKIAPGLSPMFRADLALRLKREDEAVEILGRALEKVNGDGLEKLWHLESLISHTVLLRLMCFDSTPSKTHESLRKILPFLPNEEDFISAAVETIEGALDSRLLVVRPGTEKPKAKSWNGLLKDLAGIALKTSKQEFQDIGVEEVPQVLRHGCRREELEQFRICDLSIPSDMKEFFHASNGFRGTSSFASYGIGPLEFFRQFEGSPHVRLFEEAIENEEELELEQIEGIIEMLPYGPTGRTEDGPYEESAIKHLIVFPCNVSGCWWDTTTKDHAQVALKENENYRYIQFDDASGEISVWRDLRAYIEELL